MFDLLSQENAAMTSPSITYASVTELIDQPIDAVWPVIAAFGGVEHWIPGITACTVEGSGVGAVRTVVSHGNSVQERIEALDDEARLLRYHILPPHSVPVDGLHGNIRLAAIDDTTTELTWWSDATQFHAPQDVVSARIETFYRRSIEGLRALLAAGDVRAG
jgi:hypothetical protein